MDTHYFMIFVCLGLISAISCAPASTAERMWLVKARQRRAEQNNKIDAVLHMLVKRQWCLYCDSAKTDTSSSTTSTATPTTITTTTTTSTTSPTTTTTTTAATQKTQTTRCTWRNWWKCLFRF